MAKGNLFLSQARGKVGSVVFSRLNGQQITRVHNPAPANPQSIGQLYQRAILATTAKAAAELREIIDHSWQGVKYNADSNNEFMRRNLDLLRSASVDSEGVVKVAIKGNAWAPLNDYIISAGSLDGPVMGLITGEYATRQATWVTFRGNDLGEAPILEETPITNAEQYNKALQFLFGCNPGQQVTIVQMYEDERRTAEYNGVTQRRTTLKVDRICFKDAAAVDFAAAGTILLANATRDKWFINPLFCDFSADEFGPRTTDTFTSATGGGIIITAESLNPQAATGPDYAIRYGYNPAYDYALGIIISEKVNGEWKRSDAQMLSTSSVRELEAIVPSYGKGEAEELGGNQWYLNQARSVRSGGTAYQQASWVGARINDDYDFTNPVSVEVPRRAGQAIDLEALPLGISRVEWASDEMREIGAISVSDGGDFSIVGFETEDNSWGEVGSTTRVSVIGYDANDVPLSGALDIDITWVAGD